MMNHRHELFSSQNNEVIFSLEISSCSNSAISGNNGNVGLYATIRRHTKEHRDYVLFFFLKIKKTGV